MKKLSFLSTFILLCTVLFSCTADESESQEINAVKKTIKPSITSYAGPGDQPIIVPPPPTK